MKDALLWIFILAVIVGCVAFMVWAELDVRKCYRTCEEFNAKQKEEGGLSHCVCR